MWICFDCKTVRASMNCRRKHRCINVDLRSWERDDWIVWVGDIFYTDASFSKISAVGQAVKDKRYLEFRQGQIIREKYKPMTIRFNWKEVHFVILTEEQFKQVEKEAEERNYEDEISLIDDRLEKIYLDFIRYGKVQSFHDYEVEKLKQGVQKYGFKYVEQLRNKVESNEWISEKMKMKVLEILLEDIL